MKVSKRLLRLNIVAAFAAVVAIMVQYLALVDIFHGEVDTTLEWNIVLVSLLSCLAFIILTTLTLITLLRQPDKSGTVPSQS
jgi:hypothetical protein